MLSVLRRFRAPRIDVPELPADTNVNTPTPIFVRRGSRPGGLWANSSMVAGVTFQIVLAI